MALYTMNDATPREVRVLLYQLQGAIDAGRAGELAIDQLLMTLPSTRITTFRADELVDYRARRPMMTFSDHAYREVEEPVLALDLLQDDDGQEFLLLHGYEPDYRWQEFARDLETLVHSFGVKQTIGMTGLPMPVPHTRPAYIYHHGNRAEELPEQPDIFGTAEVLGSAAAYLEWRFGRLNLSARGISVAVPHYAARYDYPIGAAALLGAVAEVGGLALPVGDLEAAARANRAEIDEAAAEQPEVAAVVQALEAQYDSMVPVEGEVDAISRLLDVPSADEIGARLEAYLESNVETKDKLAKDAEGPFPTFGE